jgi:hypothetical protein
MNAYRGTGQLERAAFTVSLDFELMWGTKDRPYGESFRKLCEIERREVVDRLLGLLTAYGIRATWGVVGNLFLKKDHEDPLLYGSELIEKIRRCPVRQEIGSHTMTHAVLGSPDCTAAMAERELGDWARVARANAVGFQTLILPRNCIGTWISPGAMVSAATAEKSRSGTSRNRGWCGGSATCWRFFPRARRSA